MRPRAMRDPRSPQCPRLLPSAPPVLFPIMPGVARRQTPRAPARAAEPSGVVASHCRKTAHAKGKAPDPSKDRAHQDSRAVIQHPSGQGRSHVWRARPGGRGGPGRLPGGAARRPGRAASAPARQSAVPPPVRPADAAGGRPAGGLPRGRSEPEPSGHRPAALGRRLPSHNKPRSARSRRAFRRWRRRRSARRPAVRCGARTARARRRATKTRSRCNRPDPRPSSTRPGFAASEGTGPGPCPSLLNVSRMAHANTAGRGALMTP